ncbi:hypothetical protein [Paenibacillus antarcticus]|uniref:Uncharacterized protein n=1 Tax=Paenibacillus antarcticus TaxID=253703 RepID=A0A168P9S1_9BACL|nr:hypothetical protein [Paenibacillus antarcticus]OAB46541.1 hypothetical protein PBAT_11015 [Paenibacillus antarcticus]
MKKLVSLCLLVLVVSIFAGCSSPKEDEVSLDRFIEAYKKQGIEVNIEAKPAAQLIQAKDGIVFISDKKIAIYEYETAKELKKIQSEEKLIQEWKTNGRFLLETKDDKAEEIFTNVN